MPVKRLNSSKAEDYCLFQALICSLLGFPNLRSGTTAAQLRNDATAYRIHDRVFNLAATDGTALTGTATTATQVRKVRVEIDADGTLSFVHGANATAQVLAPMPRRTANRATLGWIEIPASFTFGTTSLAAAGVTIYNGDPDLGGGEAARLHPNDRGIDSTIYGGP